MEHDVAVTGGGLTIELSNTTTWDLFQILVSPDAFTEAVTSNMIAVAASLAQKIGGTGKISRTAKSK
jgi:hypothetical protein